MGLDALRCGIDIVSSCSNGACFALILQEKDGSGGSFFLVDKDDFVVNFSGLELCVIDVTYC